MSAEFDFNVKPNTDFSTLPMSDAGAMAGDDERMWELLSLYADGEAAPDEAAQVEQMLRHDAEYARMYTFLRESGNAVRGIVEVEPPAYLRNAILAKTTQRVTVTRRLALAWDALRGRLAAPVGRLSLAGGGLAACALLIGVYVGHSEPQTNGAGSRSNTAFVAGIRPRVLPAMPSAPAAPPRYELPDPVDFAPQQANAAPVASPSVTEPGQNSRQSPASTAIAPPLVAANTDRSKPDSRSAAPDVTSGATPTIAKAVTAPVGGIAAPAAGKSSLSEAKHEAKSGVQIAKLPSRRKYPTAQASDDMRVTQNLYPMMDSSVQHRTASMPMGMDGMMSDGDNLDDGTFVTSHDSPPAIASADTPDDSSAPGEGHRIVGKLQIAKLPPSARHLLTPSEVVRQANAAALRYSAAATDVTPHREADVPVMTLRY